MYFVILIYILDLLIKISADSRYLKSFFKIMEIKELTRAEEQIMQVLWQLKKGFVKDVIDALPEPKPAYNTVSTFIRILETKGFVDHSAFGKSHEYFPIISKEQYQGFATEKRSEERRVGKECW